MPLNRDDIEAIYQIALKTGLADPGRRSLLLAWLPANVTASLAVKASPGAQLESDLITLNGLSGAGDPPLATWLRNAERMTDIYPGVPAQLAGFRQRLAEVPVAQAAPAVAAPAVAAPAVAASAGSVPGPLDAYDVFICYPSAARAHAIEIGTALEDVGLTVFLDQWCLLPGDRWDDVLPEAQAASRMTVVVATTVGRSYYDREEIAQAIDMSRESDHRVVPVFVDAAARKAAKYGLRRLHGYLLSETAVETIVAAIQRALAR